MTTFNESTAKNTLLEILQSKHLPLEIFFTTGHVGGFVSYISIDEVFGDEEFYGDVRSTKKEAEKSAALSFLRNNQALLMLQSYNTESESVMTEFGPPKNRILEILQALGLQPSSAVFNTHIPDSGSGFVTVLTIPLVFGDRTFVGAARGTKKDADRSAAMVFLSDAAAVAALQNYRPGRMHFPYSSSASASSADNGSYAANNSLAASVARSEAPEITTSVSSNVIQLAIKLEVTTPNGNGSSHAAPTVTLVPGAVSPAVAAAPVSQPPSFLATAAPRASAEVLTGPPKNHILEILQRRGYPPELALFSAQSIGGGFQGSLSIPRFFGERVFRGEVCATKKEAELKAAMAFINDAEAIRRLRTFNPL